MDDGSQEGIGGWKDSDRILILRAKEDAIRFCGCYSVMNSDAGDLWIVSQ